MKTHNYLKTEANMLQRLLNSDSIFDNGLFYPYYQNKKQFCIPAVNISETDTDFVIEMAAPGYEKKDFKVNIQRDELSIAVERETQTEETKKNDVYRREYSYGNFCRSFTLPKGVDTTAISAAYTNGILTIKVPKATPQDTTTSVEIQ